MTAFSTSIGGLVSLKFGLQHPSFSFDGHGAQIADSLKQLVLRAESSGFDSFWVMDHFHQINFVGAPDEPMLEGRDYNEILKTKLTRVVICKSKDEAERRLAELFDGAPPERIKEMAIYGTPEDVYHEIEALRDAGIEYLIVNFGTKYESEEISLFADQGIKHF